MLQITELNVKVQEKIHHENTNHKKVQIRKIGLQNKELSMDGF